MKTPSAVATAVLSVPPESSAARTSPARETTSVPVSGQTTFDLTDAHGRYLVVWITDLGSLASAHVNAVSAS